jgi:hypothetical protein
MWGIETDEAWAMRAVLAAIIAIAVVALGGLRRSADRSLPPALRRS